MTRVVTSVHGVRSAVVEDHLMISDNLLGALRFIATAMARCSTMTIDEKTDVLVVAGIGVSRMLMIELAIALYAITDGHDARIIFRQHRKRSMIDAHLRAATLYWGYRAGNPRARDGNALKHVRSLVSELADRSDVYLRKIAQRCQAKAIQRLEQEEYSLEALKAYLRKKKPRATDVDK